MKRIFSLFTFGLVTLFFISTSSIAEEVKPQPLDPAYEGIHGMVLVSKSSTVFASHMPSYKKPKNIQLLYKLSVKDVNLVQVVRDNPLVTVKPEKFNLQRLMRDEKLVVKADVYIGHYEKDGMLVYEGMELNFDKQLFLREMDELTEPGRLQEYSSVSYNSKNDRLYIHHIQQAPSYDQIIHIDVEASCPTKIATRSSVPQEQEVFMRLLNCGTIAPMYYNAESFTQ